MLSAKPKRFTLPKAPALGVYIREYRQPIATCDDVFRYADKEWTDLWQGISGVVVLRASEGMQLADDRYAIGGCLSDVVFRSTFKKTERILKQFSFENVQIDGKSSSE